MSDGLILINRDHTGGNENEARAAVAWLQDLGFPAFYGWNGIPECPASAARAHAELAKYREHKRKQATQAAQQESEVTHG